jgi:membrane protein implicated in regulation of membrane protease activity
MHLWKHRLSWSYRALLVVVLTGFFSIDDFLLLIFFRRSKFVLLHPFWYTISCLFILIGSLLLALVVIAALRRRPVTGAEGLVGQRGEVIRLSSDGCQVRISGEIWEVISPQALEIGDAIQVESIDGLVLRVRLC